jgi:uncharacterized phiE125 gp8 family phage protein
MREPSALSSLVVPPAEEPLTLEQAKARAGFDWVSPDPRDALLTEHLRAARHKVERDTGLALLTQTRDVWLSAFPITPFGVIRLPAQCRPLQSVTSMIWRDTAGLPATVPPEAYVVDLARGEIGLSAAGIWPPFGSLQAVSPITIRVVAGWLDAATFAQQAPLLLQAVGLLTAHFATAGRDAVAGGGDGLAEVPFGYAAAIASFEPIEVI